MSNKFNDILASDGVEAAGGSTREGGRADGGDLVLSNTAESLKAPAAAPVCEWTPGGEHGGLQPSCTDIWTFSPYVALPNKCPGCKRAISIKSEAAR